MSQYPEHEKLKALGGQNQLIGDFLEWLQINNYTICAWNDRRNRGEYIPSRNNINAWIGEFFEIDENVLEKEKLQMLEQIRKQG